MCYEALQALQSGVEHALSLGLAALYTAVCTTGQAAHFVGDGAALAKSVELFSGQEEDGNNLQADSPCSHYNAHKCV